MRNPPDVRLELVSRPESLGAVAAAIDGVVTALDLDALDADGIQTAAAEACKNVVLHAYEGDDGPLDVELRIHDEIVEVTVVDHGIGIRPHLGERRYPHNGLGLPIIHRHAWRATYTNLPGGGTELRMEFSVSGGEPGQSADRSHARVDGHDEGRGDDQDRGDETDTGNGHGEPETIGFAVLERLLATPQGLPDDARAEVLLGSAQPCAEPLPARLGERLGPAFQSRPVEILPADDGTAAVVVSLPPRG